jgi:hypothetical protein
MKKAFQNSPLIRREARERGHDAILRHLVWTRDFEAADHECVQMAVHHPPTRSRTKRTTPGSFGRFFSLRFLTQKELSHGTRL